MLFIASKMAIVSLFRVWAGIFHITTSMITSFVEAIKISQPNTRVSYKLLLMTILVNKSCKLFDNFKSFFIESNFLNFVFFILPE